MLAHMGCAWGPWLPKGAACVGQHGYEQVDWYDSKATYLTVMMPLGQAKWSIDQIQIRAFSGIYPDSCQS